MSAKGRLASATTSPLGSLVLAPVTRWGYARYRKTGRTPPIAYSTMRKLFAARPSRFDDLVAQAATEAPGAVEHDADPQGLVASCADDALDALQRDGCYVLPVRLDDRSVDELHDAATRASCTLIGAEPGAPPSARFDATAPIAVRYDVDEQTILRVPAAQRLVADDSVRRLAQRYLGATPVQDLVAMWWSAARGPRASAPAAQQFHFDLDRLRFIKLFVYLTDVDAMTGPHVFVPGSHRELPRELRDDRRYGDDEVLTRFPHELRIAGPRGTVFLADTRGLHKGLPLEQGHRLVFQLQYSSSLFGAPFEAITLEAGPELTEAIARHPWTYRRYSLGAGS
jgi:hypothetical protein